MVRLLAILALITPLAASAQDSAAGQDAFARHCAVCHGITAEGDGPMAPILSVAPADLTGLAAGNGGVFPSLRVVERIDGKMEVLAHGGPMPVFGLILQGPSGVVVAPDGAEAVAPEAIVDIVTWLAEVQK